MGSDSVPSTFKVMGVLLEALVNFRAVPTGTMTCVLSSPSKRMVALEILPQIHGVLWFFCLVSTEEIHSSR